MAEVLNFSRREFCRWMVVMVAQQCKHTNTTKPYTQKWLKSKFDVMYVLPEKTEIDEIHKILCVVQKHNYVCYLWGIVALFSFCFFGFFYLFFTRSMSYFIIKQKRHRRPVNQKMFQLVTHEGVLRTLPREQGNAITWFLATSTSLPYREGQEPPTNQ